VIPDFGDSEWVFALTKLQSSPFSGIKYLNQIYGVKSILKKAWLMRKNAEWLRKFVRQYIPDRVYVCNDRRIEAQTALYISKKINSEAIGIYVEDGLNIYSLNIYSPFRFKSNLIVKVGGKILFTPRWEDIKVFGTSRLIDEVRSIFPEFVRPEVSKTSIFSIERDPLLKLREEESFFIELMESRGVKFKELQAKNVIFLISHPEQIKDTEKYNIVANNLIEKLTKMGLGIGIKYHPRSPLTHSFEFKNIEEITILPPFLPVELFYLVIKKLKFVIGPISTSLVTAKWLLNNVEVYYSLHEDNILDAQLSSLFSKLDIRPLEIENL